MTITNIINQKDWKELIKTYLPVSIATSFSFTESMRIVGSLFQDSSEVEDGNLAVFMRDYAVNLMIILREKYAGEWKEDWKNEAFLGICCGLVYREEEAFKYLKNLLSQFRHPPQSLILAVIRSGAAPAYFLSETEIIQLTQEALQQGSTYEIACLMIGIATNQKEKADWEQRACELEKNKIHTAVIIPNILKNILPKIEGYRNEE